VVDIGCGTGTFACRLAEEGVDVVGVDPAGAMLGVARRKSAAERVRWVHGVTADVPAMNVDLATMTGNVAQVFLDDDEWAETLTSVYRVLRPGGSLVFETRRPERMAWLEWNPRDSFQRLELEGAGEVVTWDQVIAVSLPFVTFRGTIMFRREGTVLTSDSTLRFRSHDEVAASLGAAGFRVNEVRDAPDRPGRELIFLATRP
jgi:ubiquinone/menaquinone biosynthesis C-methylase UbiE